MLAWSCHVQECNSWLTKVHHLKSSESIFEAPAFLMSASSASSSSQIGHDFLQYNWQCNHNSWLQFLGMISTHDRRVLIHHHPESVEIDSTNSKSTLQCFPIYMRFFCNSPRYPQNILTQAGEWPGGPRSHTSPANASQMLVSYPNMERPIKKKNIHVTMSILVREEDFWPMLNW